MDLASFDQFSGLKRTSLESLDVLALSFHAARGLPGLQKSNLEKWACKRDAWAYQVQFETARHLYRYNPSSEPPTESFYGNSLGRFLCYFLLQVLQCDCGVKYHPGRKMSPGSCRPADIFAHGILDDDGEGGTCASMPVVYVSVGRRLGYPLYLVETKGHLFCRWDDSRGAMVRWQNPRMVLRVPPDRFNFDGSGEGIAFHPDEYYKTWPEAWSDFETEQGYFLESLSADRTFAAFLMERGECFWDFGMRDDAMRSYHYARQLVPNDERYKRHEAARFKQYALDRFALEEHKKMQRQRLPQAIPHGIGCSCRQCMTAWHQMHLAAEHAPCCQCLPCQRQRATQPPAAVPGHPPGCPCSHCRRLSHQPHA